MAGAGRWQELRRWQGWEMAGAGRWRGCRGSATLLMLKDRAECGRLLEDLCTRQEIEEMGRRLQVARLLYRGENYGEIAGKTGVSTATISRVNRALRYGEGGYRLVMERSGETGA